MNRRPPISTLFPHTALFRSVRRSELEGAGNDISPLEVVMQDPWREHRKEACNEDSTQEGCFLPVSPPEKKSDAGKSYAQEDEEQKNTLRRQLGPIPKETLAHGQDR